MIDRLRAWVACETPSHAPGRVRALGGDVAAAFAAAGAEIVPTGDEPVVEVLFAGADGSAGERLLLGHLDTVYAVGTLADMPFQVLPDRVRGPGVLDMKGGVVSALFAFRALAACGLRPAASCRLLLVGDEETGSAASRPLTEQRARRAREVFVLEPGTGPGGALKTARKGIARYLLRARGIAAHAGVDFDAGASAIVELARQIVSMSTWCDAGRGLTINAGTITGGTASNVVAAAAQVELDVRAPAAADLAAIDARLRALTPNDPRVRLELEGGLNRPPMEPTPAGTALFERARALGAQVGLALESSATGGGSDGNFTAALGVPTLDGLGMAGGGAHSPGEFALLAPWPARTALLALLLCSPD